MDSSENYLNDTGRTGKVKFFSTLKQYGFIVDDDSGQEVFFHSSHLKQPVQKNDRVTYDLGGEASRPLATNVVKDSIDV